MKKLHRSNCGHTILRSKDTLVIQFDSERSIAGNSNLNGGIRPGITAIFNHTIHSAEDLPGGSVEQYLRKVAADNGLEPENCSGLLTAAGMQNSVIQALSFRQLGVEAAVTAGVDINGGRAGDPASYFEEAGHFYNLFGTINILLVIDANLPPYALLKSIITATEAKTAALQELMVPGNYSAGLATGSGTDGIIVAANPASCLKLTDAGLHSKLGELIGTAVKKGVKKALAMETGLSPERQLNTLERLKRYNVDVSYFWKRAKMNYPSIGYEEYLKTINTVVRMPKVVALSASLLHLQDEVKWGLLPEKQAVNTAAAMLRAILTGGLPKISSFQEPANTIIEILVDGINCLVVEKLIKLVK